MNSPGASKGNILIVDDTPDNLRLLSSALTERGYKVRSVINGAMALMGAQAAPPDLIMLDIKMPDLDGYEVCQRLKDDRQTREIPVIFISALDEVFDKVKAFTSGGVDYIQKPFQVEEVLARIENQLTVRRLQMQLQEQNQQLQQTQANLLQALEQERSLKQRIEEMAAIEERNRIAREIHDSLGHSLTALNVQLQAAASLLLSDPIQAQSFLAQAQRLGITAMQEVRQSVRALRTDDDRDIAQSMRSGAKGYLLKDMPAPELAEAIRLVHRGYSQMAPGLMEKLLTNVPDSGDGNPPTEPEELTHLPPRERDVLRLIGQGCTNREIATQLHLAEGTVKTYVTHILNRLTLRNRSQLAIYANSIGSVLNS